MTIMLTAKREHELKIIKMIFSTKLKIFFWAKMRL